MTRFILSCTLVLLAALVSPAQPDLKGKSLADTFNELLPGLGRSDSAAQQRWQDICFQLGAPGNDKQRAEACALMCAKLDAKTPTAARLWLLTQLEHIGREESVAALAAVIDDKDDTVREAAVRALANNPSPKATGALASKLAGAKGSARVGLLNALGHRGDAAAVKMIAKELTSDEATAIAAARALGRIPGPAALDAVDGARKNTKGAVHKAAAEAVLVHADRLRKSGREDEFVLARALYKTLNGPEEPRPVQMAALRGMIRTAGDGAGALVLEILAGADPAAQNVAIGQIESLSAGALKTLAASLDKLPVPSRVSVITAIGARGDRTQVPTVIAAAKSPSAELKRAGLLALGRLGDASAVEFLLDVMSSKDALAGTAAESLAQLPAEGVDEKLVAVLAKEKTAARAVALIAILERRKAASAVPALLAAAGGTDAAVRTAAFNALRALAAPEHVPDMVAALGKTEKGKDREAAEGAVAAVCAQIPKPEKRAEPVLAALKEDKGRTADLLPLLGRIGGPDALAVLRTHLASTDAALRFAALTGFYNWPDGAANEDLLALAAKEKQPADRLAALQTLIRVNTVLVDRTPEERLAALGAMKKAMPLATRDDERRAILAGLGNVRHIETLRFVVPYLDEPALAQAACKGVVELAHSKMLRDPNRAEFAKALDRVIALCKDKGLVERAKQYKEGR
jgi:HEAT repeat protein